MIQFLKKRWVYHSLIWATVYIIFFISNYRTDNGSDSIIEYLIGALFQLIPILLVTYLGFTAKEKLFDKRKYFLYLIAFVVIVFIGVGIYEALDLIDRGVNIPMLQKFSNFAFLQLFTVGLQYFKRGIVNQHQLQELRAKTIETELNALKAQINPHFLFNTLNNIYGMNQIDSEKGSEMIMELADVMRYHLEFSKEGEVKLEDEIQLLKSYIKLERLRLRETCDVQIDFDQANESLMISPLLLIPFVENAFKHGTHPTKDCFVHIQLRTTVDQLVLRVENSIILNRKVVKTNIGLKNTKRRLELLYPQKHNLNIVSNEDHHLVELSINL